MCLKIVSYVLAVVLALLLLEFATRLHYSPVELLYLPHFGLTASQHNYNIWKNRPEDNPQSTQTEPYPFDEYDKYLGWKNKPNANVRHIKSNLWDVIISTNKFGLRGIHPQHIVKPSDKNRIGFLGASQTFGESVKDGKEYVTILDQMMSDVEILNFGVRGYGTDQMLLYYEREVKEYNLDITVLSFAFHHIPRSLNEFTFFAKPYFIIDDSGIKIAGAPVPTRYDLFDRPIATNNINILNRSAFMRLLLKLYKSLNNQKFYNKNSEAWQLTKFIIERFANVVKENQSYFIVLNIEHNYPHMEPELDILGEKLDIEIINLGPTIRKLIKKGYPIQIPEDNHWSELGHQYIAKAIHTEFCTTRRVLECD